MLEIEVEQDAQKISAQKISIDFDPLFLFLDRGIGRGKQEYVIVIEKNFRHKSDFGGRAST